MTLVTQPIAAIRNIAASARLMRPKMLYRPIEREPRSTVRELSLICALAAFGLLITVGAMWAGWEIAASLP